VFVVVERGKHFVLLHSRCRLRELSRADGNIHANVNSSQGVQSGEMRRMLELAVTGAGFCDGPNGHIRKLDLPWVAVIHV
jgi:hypothetical protein